MEREQTQNILYEPDERPPFFFALGLGFQAIIGLLIGVAAFVLITARAGGQSDSYLSWAIFSAFTASGIVIILQSLRVWRFGARYTLICGPSAMFVAICSLALREGGPAMMSTLILVSTVFQFALTSRLSMLRRVITPTVSGTVLILLAGTAMSVVLGTLSSDELSGMARSGAYYHGGELGGRSCPPAVRNPALAAVDAHHRHCVGLRGGRGVRNLRSQRSGGGPLVRHSRPRVAGIRSPPRSGVLGSASGFHNRLSGILHQRDRGGYSRSAGRVASASRHRFPGDSGSSQRREPGQPGGGAAGDASGFTVPREPPRAPY